jgi:isopenicillin N synthase-like dioxygenase
MSPSPSHLLPPTEIPTIDLRLADDLTTRPAVLDKLRHALTDVGFLYLSNHQVPSAVTEALTNSLPGLFGLSQEAKDEVALENSPHFLGYSAVGSEVTAGKTDAREQFEFATELAPIWRPGLPLYERLVGPNQVRFASLTVVTDRIYAVIVSLTANVP